MVSLRRKRKSQPLDQILTPPKTPDQNKEKLVHLWPEPNEELNPPKRRKVEIIEEIVGEGEEFAITYQEVLLLHSPKQKYTHTKKQPVPELKNDREMLVAVQVIGLNPIDWKAPDFGWGLPTLPCISGRDLAGEVVRAPKSKSRFRKGDIVMAVSTDYRDSRKAAYQQYAVASDFNACRLPNHLSAKDAAPLGVAYAAAALALGICIGLNFQGNPSIPRGPDLLQIIRGLPRDALPQDIRLECFEGIPFEERAKPGDWIAIWGGSSATGCCAVQLAKLAGLKVIAIVDLARSGERMLKYGADLLVDRINPERAIEVVKGITKRKLRFGLDTRGKETAKLLTQAMCNVDGVGKSHLIGLTGLPKDAPDGMVYHTVPIKSFHEAPQIGESLMIWLEELLDQKLLKTLDVEIADGGLEGINAALDRLRDGSVNGPRIVVPLTV